MLGLPFSNPTFPYWYTSPSHHHHVVAVVFDEKVTDQVVVHVLQKPDLAVPAMIPPAVEETISILGRSEFCKGIAYFAKMNSTLILSDRQRNTFEQTEIYGDGKSRYRRRGNGGLA